MEPVNHIRWSFYAKTNERLKAINYFQKKAPLQMFDRVQITPLQITNYIFKKIFQLKNAALTKTANQIVWNVHVLYHEIF